MLQLTNHFIYFPGTSLIIIGEFGPFGREWVILILRQNFTQQLVKTYSGPMRPIWYTTSYQS